MLEYQDPPQPLRSFYHNGDLTNAFWLAMDIVNIAKGQRSFKDEKKEEGTSMVSNRFLCRVARGIGVIGTIEFIFYTKDATTRTLKSDPSDAEESSVVPRSPAT